MPQNMYLKCSMGLFLDFRQQNTAKSFRKLKN